VTTRLVAAAELELDDAVAFYNRQRAGLGIAFADSVRNGIQRIEEYPDAWSPLGGVLRRYRLDRFPYGIVYARLEAEIIVIAIMHLHRNPDYRRDRLSSLK
jgi:toxin ParE2